MNELQANFEARRAAVLVPLAARIEGQLRELLNGAPRIDRVQARAKAFDRFMDKAWKVEDGKLKYEEPLHQIQDQIGTRVVVFYLSDVARVTDTIMKYYRPIEFKFHVPES